MIIISARNGLLTMEVVGGGWHTQLQRQLSETLGKKPFK
jgi:hypothetical protein